MAFPNEAPASAVSARPGISMTVVMAWLVAGTLDITTAIVYYARGSGPRTIRLLQGIASGVLGADAFSGGIRTALMGLGLHYLIALIWTLVLSVALASIAGLRRHLIPTGIAYGVFVWLVMNLVVLPLSNVRQGPIQLAPAMVGAVILAFCIGLPISLIVGRHMRASDGL